MANLSHRPFKLSIAEWELYNYWRFDHEKPVRFVKEDVIKGVCDEMMDFLAFTEFSKLSLETKADIIAIIIKQKKKDGKYIEFDQPYSYEDEQEE